MDPVKAADGQQYERSCVIKWIAERKTSPVTKQQLTEEDLKTPKFTLTTMQQIASYLTLANRDVFLNQHPQLRKA